MNTTSANVIRDIVNKIPVTLYFTEIPDRQQALKYINWLYLNIPQSKTVSQDQLFREVISRELRIVSMKIIEIEILIMTGLNTITLEDFTIDSDSLLKKIISQNQDKYDLDIMYRVLAQIMTKLPRDLKDQVTGKHKLLIFQSVSRFIKMEPQLFEKFISLDPLLNNTVTMELDGGDYDTLNKQYLNDLKTYQESRSYIESDSMDYVQYATNATNMLGKIPTITGTIKGQYIDTKPILMTGVDDDKIYYFDSSSGTMSEMPSIKNSSSQVPVSLNDLSNILQSHNVNKNQIQDLIANLNPITTKNIPSIPIITQPASFTDKIGALFGYSVPVANVSQAAFIPNTTVSSTMPIPPQFLVKNNDNIYSHNQHSKDHTHSYLSYGLQPPSSSSSTSEKEQWQYLFGPNGHVPNETFSNDSSSSKQLSDLRLKYNNNFNKLQKTYETFTNNNENDLLKKLQKNNKDIENVATAFVSIIVLLFLLVIFNSIRNKNGLDK